MSCFKIRAGRLTNQALFLKAQLPILVLALNLHCGNRAESPPGESVGAASAGQHKTEGSESVECPVCGLKFKKSEASYTYRHNECDYYFLLEDHQKAFKDSCQKRLSAPKPRPPSSHPENGLCRPEACD